MSPFEPRCPGQNTMFWKPDDVYDVACPGCGHPVEFWKDDARRTCGCGYRFANPKRDLGCLEYCKYAESCMPEMFEGESRRALYRDRLIAAIRSKLGPDAETQERMSEAADLAEQMFAEEGGDPKVVIAAAVFSSLIAVPVRHHRSSPSAAALDRQEAISILSLLRTEAEVVDQICRIVWNRDTDVQPDDINMRIVRDALAVQALAPKRSLLDRDAIERLLAVMFLTGTATRLARERLLPGVRAE